MPKKKCSRCGQGPIYINDLCYSCDLDDIIASERYLNGDD